MAWNPSPHVADCREIARKWGVQQVVIVGINTRKSTFEVSSFGETKALCADAKKLNDRIFRMLESGEHEFDMNAYELASLRQLAATTPKDELATPLMEQRIAELSNIGIRPHSPAMQGPEKWPSSWKHYEPSEKLLSIRNTRSCAGVTSG